MMLVDKVKKYLKEIEANNKKGKGINAFLEVRDEKELLEEARKIDDKIKKGKAGKLAGMIIGIKANINVKGLKISCASKTLENYKGTYDATVIKKIKDEDGLIIGITNMDEFACGSSGETSAFGPTKNPSALGKVPGGSSSGSAASIAASFCDLTLGSDTGCSIRLPASHCGVVGFKPSYGSTSRYGLVDLSMSLDQIGPLAKNVSDAKLLFDVIKGYDNRDPTTFDLSRHQLPDHPTPKKSASPKLSGKKKEFVIGLLDLEGLKVDSRIKDLIEKRVNEVAKEKKFKVVKVKIPNLDLAVETYYPLVYVEFYSGTRKFDGRRYGLKIEDSAGPEVQRRILGGSEITKSEFEGRYYNKALKVKRVFEESLKKVFEKVDCIICPTVPRLPHEIGAKISVEEMYSYDVLTIPFNLYGNCAISIPAGTVKDESSGVDVPVGMQIACDKLEDDKAFEIAREFED